MITAKNILGKINEFLLVGPPHNTMMNSLYFLCPNCQGAVNYMDDLEFGVAKIVCPHCGSVIKDPVRKLDGGLPLDEK